MKRVNILTIILGLLLLVVVGLILKNTILRPAPAGLQVKSVPTSTVFLGEKNVGRTPFAEEKLSAGEVNLKLIPESTTGSFPSWERKIKLVGGTQTIVNWEFGEKEASSSGEMMTLEGIADKKTASLIVISSPDSSLLKINAEPKGFTPVSLDKQEAGERQIILSAAGFAERKIDVTLLAGYKLILNVKLAEEKEAEAEATATVTPTPTPTPKAGAKITPTPVKLAKPYVTIKETPTGWLRVRMEPSTTATEAAKVKPGESYPLLEGKEGWYKIKYEANKEGWISGQYAEKFE